MKKKQGSKAWLRLEVKKGLYGDAVVEQKREGCTGIRCWEKWTETPSRARPGLLGRHRHESSGMTTNANEGRGRRAGP